MTERDREGTKPLDPTEKGSAQTVAVERRTAAVAYGAHALHDGYTDLIYVLLPIWQAEFGLTYAEIGLLRGLYAGMMAGFQVPASLIAERCGAVRILALGTALAGVGFCIAGMSVGLGLLVLALVISGLGSATQHPLASALIASVFAGTRAMKAIGIYNFAGDIGKMALPALLAMLLLLMPWRPALSLLGAVGIVAGAAILALMPRSPARAPAQDAEGAAAGPRGGPTRRFGFAILFSIGVFDSGTRMAFLTFLPFLLTAKGASVQSVGLALTAVFAGGALGKLACAYLGARLGIFGTVLLTEGLTAAGIIALLPLPLEAVYILLPAIGVALNGTSSVLYGSVPALVGEGYQSRGFSIFYTGTIGAGAVSPIAFGVVGDILGVDSALVTIAAMALATLPLALLLRPFLRAPAAP